MSVTIKSPLFNYGPDNDGAPVVVVTYTLLLVSLCVAVTRLVTTIRRKREFGSDDILFYLAIVIVLPQSILVERAVDEGLGRHIETITAASLTLYYKWNYASQILAIVIQCLAKLSILLLTLRVESITSTQRAARIVGTLVILWTVFSLLLVAFQCGIPDPWIFNSEKCAVRGNLYYIVIALNIMTDGILALFFLPVLWKLHKPRPERLTLMSLFAARLLVCGVSIGNAVVLESYLRSPDKTWYNVHPTILSQIVVTSSIVTATIPSIYRFLEKLQTGRFGMQLPESEHELSATAPALRYSGKASQSRTSIKLSSKVNSKDTARNASSLPTPSSRRITEKSIQLTPDTRTKFSTDISTSSPSSSSQRRLLRLPSSIIVGRVGDDEDADNSSTRSLKGKVVQQKREFSVEYESEHDPEQDGHNC